MFCVFKLTGLLELRELTLRARLGIYQVGDLNELLKGLETSQWYLFILLMQGDFLRGHKRDIMDTY